ncbi:UNVERIFIED_CONTAM: DNA-directed RNA polymerase subunit beta'' [Sesamum latifolium]|uniref:DNA-directed RNA polymerase subunit beta n=1 Tax=Sesamum latifolium TaxID=2727402 RepID=A0AAW2VHT5_9LAMI
MSAQSRSVKRRSTSNLSGTNDQSRLLYFVGKKEDRIPDYLDLSRIIYTGPCNLIDPTILYQNSDLFSKRRRNRFIIPLQSIQERENELMPPSGISIEIPSMAFSVEIVFLLISTILDTEERVRALLNMDSRNAFNRQKEDLIEYQGGKVL